MATLTQLKIGETSVDLVQGDITQQETDAIVNAANSSLLGGGGVDGAIHRAAGRELLAECRSLNGCETGDAKITGGYQLPAKHVIHTVGPVYTRDNNPAELLASCHRRSLDVAIENDVKSIAFPAISTGVYGYPIQEAAEVALGAVIAYIKKHQPDLELARFVLFSTDAFDTFSQTLAQLAEAHRDEQSD